MGERRWDGREAMGERREAMGSDFQSVIKTQGAIAHRSPLTARRSPLASSPGFTLLEALVAMLLIATIGMATFDWINSSLGSLGRVQAHHLRQQAIRNALAFMEQVNPMEHPTGERKMGPYSIRWESRLTEPAKDGSGYPAGISLYKLGLYDTHIRIDINEKNIAEFDLRQVGYTQVREFRINF